ncbi:hypothetical protein DL768_010145 [Monosporascus sp. mg162]|nr:hypothetical protein DL768_010145 [Monosporascus sp. mg162]
MCYAAADHGDRQNLLTFAPSVPVFAVPGAAKTISGWGHFDRVVDIAAFDRDFSVASVAPGSAVAPFHARLSGGQGHIGRRGPSGREPAVAYLGYDASAQRELRLGRTAEHRRPQQTPALKDGGAKRHTLDWALKLEKNDTRADANLARPDPVNIENGACYVLE